MADDSRSAARDVLEGRNTDGWRGVVFRHPMGFSKAETKQIHSTKQLERLNAEIERRTDVVGTFPNEAAITLLIGALLLEQSDEGALQRRYMQREDLRTLTDSHPVRLSAVIS